MTPKEAHDQLVDDIMKARPFVAPLRAENELNMVPRSGSDLAQEVMDMAALAYPNKAYDGYWVAGSSRLVSYASTWAQKFGTVAQKLQAGQRFKPSELVQGSGNTLDPALKNNLADGWHNNPITQPLEAPTT